MSEMQAQAQQVWVAFAGVDVQYNLAVAFFEGMTAQDAIEKSGIQQHIDLPEVLQLGVFGIKIEDSSHVLQAGDRVEIYRPLTINPKDIRRKRAKANPTSKYCRSNRFKQLND